MTSWTDQPYLNKMDHICIALHEVFEINHRQEGASDLIIYRAVQVWLAIPLPLVTLIHVPANQMCRTYPINQFICLEIGKRLR